MTPRKVVAARRWAADHREMASQPTVKPTAELHPGFSDSGARATPWSDTVAALEEAEIFWISTTRRDGRPHVAPLVAGWLDGAVHFVTGLGEQKAVNLLRDPRCVMTTGNNTFREGLDVVVEGQAERVLDRALLERLAELWASRLGWPYDVSDQGFHHRSDGAAPNPDDTLVPVFAVCPTKVLAFQRGEFFGQTRYRF